MQALYLEAAGRSQPGEGAILLRFGQKELDKHSCSAATSAQVNLGSRDVSWRGLV